MLKARICASLCIILQVSAGHSKAETHLTDFLQLDVASCRKSFALHEKKNKINPSVLIMILCWQGAVAGWWGDRCDAGEHLQGDREGRASRRPAGQVRWVALGFCVLPRAEHVCFELSHLYGDCFISLNVLYTGLPGEFTHTIFQIQARTYLWNNSKAVISAKEGAVEELLCLPPFTSCVSKNNTVSPSHS